MAGKHLTYKSMALKKLRVKMATSLVEKSGDIPTVDIEGDLIKQYNRADAQAKAAKSVMDDLKPEILELGTQEIFKRSCADPKKPTCTVRLRDENSEVLRVQFTSRYGAIMDVDGAEELFDDLKDADGAAVDINHFLQDTVVAKFNCDVFKDGEGRFQQRVYDKFRVAIEKVAAELGVPCPLETGKCVVALPALHERRWELFPDPADQARISSVCPNTIQVVPVTRKELATA